MICTNEDCFLEDKTIWIAALSNGQEVFQDDDRGGVYPSSAWLRLKDYCEVEGVYIDELKIKFRSHVVTIPKSEGYHFIKGIGCMVGFDPEEFFIVGTLNGGKLQRTWYKVPEILKDRTSDANPDEISKYESIIIKGSNNG